MRVLARAAIAVSLGLIACVVFLILVINLGTAEQRLLCSGELKRRSEAGEPETMPATLYANIERYRWIVFWADHDGMILGGHPKPAINRHLKTGN